MAPVSGLERALILGGALIGVWILLYTLLAGGLGAFLLTPFLVVAWGLWGQVVRAVFGSDEIVVARDKARYERSSTARTHGRQGVTADTAGGGSRELSDLEAGSAAVVGGWLAPRDDGPVEEDEDISEDEPEDDGWDESAEEWGS